MYLEAEEASGSEEAAGPSDISRERLPVSLMVYAGDQIYGFHGNGRMQERQDGGIQKVEISGYPEGYSDREENYS